MTLVALCSPSNQDDDDEKVAQTALIIRDDQGDCEAAVSQESMFYGLGYLYSD